MYALHCSALGAKKRLLLSWLSRRYGLAFVLLPGMALTDDNIHDSTWLDFNYSGGNEWAWLYAF